MTATAQSSVRARHLPEPTADAPGLRALPSKPRTLYDLIRECDPSPDASDDAVTDSLLANLKEMGDEGWRLARVAIRHEVGMKRRHSVRKVERGLRPIPTYTPSDGTPTATSAVRKLTLDQLREFCGLPIKIPGNGVKAGEDVTVGEWRIRMVALKQHADDTFATVNLYRDVIGTLNALKVDTIAEALIPERKRGK
jgi:hypothetical protein